MSEMDAPSLAMLEEGLRKTMLGASGPELDAALVDLGWGELLTEYPDQGVPLVFRLLGETVRTLRFSSMSCCTRQATTSAAPWNSRCPTSAPAGWCGRRTAASSDVDTLGGLPLRREEEGYPIRLAEARRAVSWWLLGSARAMLTLARQHALDRV